MISPAIILSIKNKRINIAIVTIHLMINNRILPKQNLYPAIPAIKEDKKENIFKTISVKPKPIKKYLKITIVFSLKLSR